MNIWKCAKEIPLVILKEWIAVNSSLYCFKWLTRRVHQWKYTLWALYGNLYLVSSKSDSSSLPSSLLDSSELPSSSSSDSSSGGSELFLGMRQIPSQDWYLVWYLDTRPVGYLNPHIRCPVDIQISELRPVMKSVSAFCRISVLATGIR